MEQYRGSGDRWPLDRAAAAALVMRIKRDIDAGGSESREVLLSDLLCAAWPTNPAQDQ